MYCFMCRIHGIWIIDCIVKLQFGLTLVEKCMFIYNTEVPWTIWRSQLFTAKCLSVSMQNVSYDIHIKSIAIAQHLLPFLGQKM